MRREEASEERDKNGIKPSAGNVFADLGLPRPDEALAKAELIHRIGGVIAEKGLAPAEAEAILGVEATELSALLRGRFGGVSIGRLFRYLNALGCDVQIVVRPTPRPGQGVTRVVTA